MFLHLCVILFMGGLCPSMHHMSHDRGVSPRGGLCPDGNLCPGGLHLGSFCLGGSSLSRSMGGFCPGVSVQGGSLSGRPP